MSETEDGTEYMGFGLAHVPRNTILQGDVLNWLPLLPDACVQACISSPPYWNLRDYKLPPTSWPQVTYAPMAGLPDVHVEAWDGCLGLEPTLEAYVGHLVAIFRVVRRVLRDDGVVWLNLGDAYASHAKGHDGVGTSTLDYGLAYGGDEYQEEASAFRKRNNDRDARRVGLKDKDLCLLPHRVALALQADGWWVRNDVVWAKPNPMPESVTDRCARSHEYVFHLAKSKRYSFDAQAIRETLRPKTLTTYGTAHRALGNDPLGKVKADNWSRSMPERRPAAPRKMKLPSGWDTGPGAHGAFHREGRARPEDTRPDRPDKPDKGVTRPDKQRGHSRRHAGFNDRWDAMGRAEQMANGRNRRSVWTIASHPFAEAHFATFPPELVEVCVASASRPGDLVLDPFFGAGTVGLVCRQMGRDYLGIELSPAYVAMAQRRIARVAQPSLLYAPRRTATVEALEEGVV